MKVLVSSDIHVGVPGKLQDSIWAIDVIRQAAARRDINTVLTLGDFFHDRESIPTDALSAADTIMDKIKQSGQEWLLFPGNHDMFLKMSWEINSVKHLRHQATVLDRITLIEVGGRRMWVLPFVEHEDAYMQLVRQISKHTTPEDVLLTHIGVHQAVLNECFALKHWSTVDFDDSPFELVLSGHFHLHQDVGKVVYPGSPIPFRFDEGTRPHGFLILDTDNLKWEFVDIRQEAKEIGMDYTAPDYVTITDDDINTYKLSQNDHVRVVLSRDYSQQELEDIRQHLTQQGAQSVKWMKRAMTTAGEISINQDSIKPDQLFDKWVEADKPEDLSTDKLKRMNQDVVKMIDRDLE